MHGFVQQRRAHKAGVVAESGLDYACEVVVKAHLLNVFAHGLEQKLACAANAAAYGDALWVDYVYERCYAAA